jgi:hypothetical protein
MHTLSPKWVKCVAKFRERHGGSCSNSGRRGSRRRLHGGGGFPHRLPIMIRHQCERGCDPIATIKCKSAFAWYCSLESHDWLARMAPILGCLGGRGTGAGAWGSTALTYSTTLVTTRPPQRAASSFSSITRQITVTFRHQIACPSRPSSCGTWRPSPTSWRHGSPLRFQSDPGGVDVGAARTFIVARCAGFGSVRPGRHGGRAAKRLCRHALRVAQARPGRCAGDAHGRRPAAPRGITSCSWRAAS